MVCRRVSRIETETEPSEPDAGLDVDDDGDGFTEDEGDCDDADVDVHLGADDQDAGQDVSALGGFDTWCSSYTPAAEGMYVCMAEIYEEADCTTDAGFTDASVEAAEC